MKKEERVLYIAALRQPHHKDKFVVDVCSSCLDDVDTEQVIRFASHKLRNINEASGCPSSRIRVAHTMDKLKLLVLYKGTDKFLKPLQQPYGHVGHQGG